MDWTHGLSAIVKEQIFSYLSLRDRETVRLVCKDWHRVSWSRKLILNDWVQLKDDKFTDTRTKMDRMCTVFATPGGPSPCSFLVSDFQRVLRSSRQFWKLFGPRTVRLHFTGTDTTGLQAEVLLFILEHCTALQYLSFDSKVVSFPESISDARQSTLARNLCCLREIRGLDRLSNGGKLLCNLFPVRLTNVISEVRAIDSTQHCGGASLHLHATSPAVLKSPCSLDQLEQTLATICPQSHLRVRVDDLSDRFRSRLFDSLIRHSATLRELDLSIFTYYGVKNDIAVDATLNAISCFSNLKILRLDISYYRSLEIVSSVFKNHLGLETLEVRTSGVPASVLDCWPDDAFLRAASLRSLHFEGAPVSAILQRAGSLAVIRRLTVLELLDVKYLFDADIQQLCRECTALRTLKIVDCRNKQLTDAAFTVQPNAPGLPNLRCLESLDIRGNFTRNIVAALSFARLRRLRLMIIRLTDQELMRIATLNAGLESFSTVDLDMFSYDRHGAAAFSWPAVLRFLAQCPRLVSLEIGDSPRLSKSRLQAIHIRFPNVRTVNGNRLLTT